MSTALQSQFLAVNGLGKVKVSHTSYFEKVAFPQLKF